jgi:hypothetical protein
VDVVVVAVCLALLVGFDRSMLAAERRGWVRWRRSPPSRATASTALLQILSIYQPSHEHIVEERRAADADEAEDDEPLLRGIRLPALPVAPTASEPPAR